MNAPLLRDIPEEHIMELVERLDVRGPRYTSYPTVPVWTEFDDEARFIQALRHLGANNQPIAAYIHIPFCRKRCLYCGCNSYISHDANRMLQYAEAVIEEIEHIAEHLSPNVKHGQLHFGGGTPTHLPPPVLARIIDAFIEHIPGIENAERSIEVDPRVTTDEHLAMLSERGFRRISAGLQDFDKDVQEAVQRVYTYEQMNEFIQRARSAGFTGVNIDLMYGLPRQTRTSWLTTLETVETLKPDRLACFGYAHLPSRFKHQGAINPNDLPTPRDRLGMLLDANHFFTTHGYEAIGMDHFALPDDELSIARRESHIWRNFMGYTTNRGMELLGIGCSGISEFHDLFVQNVTPPEAYVEKISHEHWAFQRGYSLDEEDLVRKQIINHLMCNLEIEIPEQIDRSDNGFLEKIKTAFDALKSYEKDGLILPRNEGYSITPLGQLFLRNLAMPFDRYLPEQSATTFSRTV